MSTVSSGQGRVHAAMPSELGLEIVGLPAPKPLSGGPGVRSCSETGARALKRIGADADAKYVDVHKEWCPAVSVIGRELAASDTSEGFGLQSTSVRPPVLGRSVSDTGTTGQRKMVEATLS